MLLSYVSGRVCVRAFARISKGGGRSRSCACIFKGGGACTLICVCLGAHLFVVDTCVRLRKGEAGVADIEGARGTSAPGPAGRARLFPQVRQGLGPVLQHSQVPHRALNLLNPTAARACLADDSAGRLGLVRIDRGPDIRSGSISFHPPLPPRWGKEGE